MAASFGLALDETKMRFVTNRWVATACCVPVATATGLIWLVYADREPTESSLNAHVAEHSPTAAAAQPEREDGPPQGLDGRTTGSSAPSAAPSGRLRHGVYEPAAVEVSQIAEKSQSPSQEWIWEEWDGDRWRYDDPHFPDLRGRDFGEADLTRVDLAGADLRGANLEGANLRRANLGSANLQGAVIKDTTFASSDLRNAVLRETDMGPPVVLFAADLRGADLRGARLGCHDCSAVTTIMHANLKGADLRGTQFGRSDIDDSSFEEADLRGANLAATRGPPASLRGALYDRDTRLPEGIDPERWEMIYVP